MANDRSSFFAVGGFLELTPISDVHYRYRVPVFKCPVCGNEEMAYHLGYPHLDPAEVLSADELRFIDGRRPKATSDQGVLIGLAKRLEDHWGVPVTSGAHFCPLRIKVGSKVKLDFDVQTIGCDFFLRRRAAELLRAEGFDFDYVEADCYGKYAPRGGPHSLDHETQKLS